jgi:hypothetical protein
VDSSTLVHVDARTRVLDYLDLCRLTRLFVVVDSVLVSCCAPETNGRVLRVSDLEVERPSQNVCELSEELCLEHAVHKRIGFIW